MFAVIAAIFFGAAEILDLTHDSKWVLALVIAGLLFVAVHLARRMGPPFAP